MRTRSLAAIQIASVALFLMLLEQPPQIQAQQQAPTQTTEQSQQQEARQAPARPEVQAPKPSSSRRSPDAAKAAGSKVPPVATDIDETPSVTHHKLSVNGQVLEYTATAAQMPIMDANGETEAHMFYVAYTLDGVSDGSRRPLTFAFNGGPGSASIWLHMGALGPRTAKMLDDGSMPPPPFKLVDNEFTWLDRTDLVFIDPVGTGYSRAQTEELAQKFNGVEGDLQSVGNFIHTYINRSERWTSPLFLAGESYGSFRAAGVAGNLIDKGIAFNGVVLISTILDYQTHRFSRGNDIPYPLTLPTYTADAWYHKKLPPDLQKDLQATLKEVENWALTDYLQALAQGDGLAPEQRQEVVEKLARYTGLDERYIDHSNLRIDVQHFTRELLRDQRLTIGRLDGRITGPSPLDAGESSEHDPSYSAIRPPFRAAFESYVRSELGFKANLHYHSSGGVLPWEWDVDNDFTSTSDQLRNAFSKNRHMKVLVLAGYYDLATPYLAVDYELKHMGIHPEMHKNISWAFYPAGHMMYIEKGSIAKMKQDIADFIDQAVPQD